MSLSSVPTIVACQADWFPQQRVRLEQFAVERTVDVHCHCLPELDDGPRNLAEAVMLCRALAEDGITSVVVTPHQLGRYERHNSPTVVRAAIDELAAELAEEQIPLEFLAAGDVRIDERLPKLVETGEIQTVAGGGKHLLLELPFELYVDPLPTIAKLHTAGVQTIMTHPERHEYLRGRVDLSAWLDAGAVLQVTAGSLLGSFGRGAHREAWDLVQRGWCSIVATDAHDARRRPPLMTAALALLTDEVGVPRARQLCIDNPLCVYRGERIDPFEVAEANAS